MDCIYCARVAAGTRDSCPLHPSERETLMMRSTAQIAARLGRESEERRRKKWGRWKVGDGVLLSASKSGELLRVFDEEGCQIRYDGVVREIGEVYATVFVLMETSRDNWGVTVYARPEDMSVNEGVTQWSKVNARAMNRKRKTGSVDSEYRHR